MRTEDIAEGIAPAVRDNEMHLVLSHENGLLELVDRLMPAGAS